MQTAINKHKIGSWLNEGLPIAPLVVFRVLFGLLLFVSILRFWANGWIETLYLEPSFHFSFYAFSWVKPFGDATYILFVVCALSALAVMLGWFYRISATLLFLSFTYIELMDKTTYLNHYYFVSLVAFLLIFLPANRAFSLDLWQQRVSSVKTISRSYFMVLWALLSLVYWSAGLAKLNSDWLIHAQPLKIWLPGRFDIPLLGPFLETTFAAYAFSWAGALYDLLIPFLLWYPKSRKWALIMVVAFHALTRLLFPIGMFPYIMMVASLLFVNGDDQQKVLEVFRRLLKRFLPLNGTSLFPAKAFLKMPRTLNLVFGFFLVWQLLWPWRHLAYPGELFWHEQGFRFSWRVMLMEKAGNAQFTVHNLDTQEKFKVQNSNFLSPFQEKQLGFQPDFILEYAHFLGDHYQDQLKATNLAIYTEAYVALNGRPSALFVDPKINLLQFKRGFNAKPWILPLNDTIYGL